LINSVQKAYVRVCIKNLSAWQHPDFNSACVQGNWPTGRVASPAGTGNSEHTPAESVVQNDLFFSRTPFGT
jgi:hypothetical protein